MARPQPRRTMRSALMRREMEDQGSGSIADHRDSLKASSWFPTPDPLIPRSPIPGARVPPPHPAGHAEDRQAQRAAPNRAPSARALRGQHFAIGVDSFPVGELSRPRPLTTLGHRNPPGEIGKRLRRARRTLLRVVHFLAIEAHARGPQLHGSSVLGSTRRLSLRTTAVERRLQPASITRRSAVRPGRVPARGDRGRRATPR